MIYQWSQVRLAVSTCGYCHCSVSCRAEIKRLSIVIVSLLLIFCAISTKIIVSVAVTVTICQGEIGADKPWDLWSTVTHIYCLSLSCLRITNKCLSVLFKWYLLTTMVILFILLLIHRITQYLQIKKHCESGYRNNILKVLLRII